MNMLTFEDVLSAVSSEVNLLPGAVANPNKRTEYVQARHLTMYLMDKHLFGAKLLPIAAFFKCDPSTTRYGIQQMKQKIPNSLKLQRYVTNIEQALGLKEKE